MSIHLSNPPTDAVPAPPRPPVAHVRIRPTTGWRALNLAEIWKFRELLFFLAWRDIKLRYKQTALGVAWVVIQPLFTMLVFSVFFGELGGMKKHLDQDGAARIPYPLFVLAALLPWQLFSYALTQSSNSLVSEQRLISKVYFPRLIVPLASVLAGLVDFLVTFVLVLAMMAWYGIWPGWAVLTVPLFVVLAIVTALAVGLWLSALNVKYRDFKYTIPFLTQFWLFATPIAYPSSIVPERWRALYGLNPMAGVVEGFRWALLGNTDAPGPMLAVSVAAVAVAFVGGLFYFRRLERTFADLV